MQEDSIINILNIVIFIQGMSQFFHCYQNLVVNVTQLTLITGIKQVKVNILIRSGF